MRAKRLAIILVGIILISFTISYAERDNEQASVLNSKNTVVKNSNSIDVEYEYDSYTNQVIAKIISNIELKDTKPSWKLDTNRKIYTKVFTSNMTYSTPVEDIYGNVINVDIEITEVKSANITMNYIYNGENNTVTAQITSDFELKPTKPSWNLSMDKKVYTKVFTSNIDYSTPVEDIYGNVINVDIEITEVKSANITMNYIYNGENNTVTAQITSDFELKPTKPSWNLSMDKKVYTKVFTSNIDYSTPVEDIYGNIINVDIKITEVKIAEIIMDYIYDKKDNTVIAKITSNINLKETKPSWDLSVDKKTYTKVFTENITYNTPVEDIYGNIIDVFININEIDIKPPTITLLYKYNDDDTVTISIKSDEELGETKPSWNLSNDKKTYSKVFETNQDYTTPVEDIYGNSTNVKIKLEKKKNEYIQIDGSKISVGYMYTSYDNVIVQITSTVRMENTKPSWKLSEDGYTYTKTFYEDTKYTTPIQDINGLQKDVYINVDMFFEVLCEIGSYGISGAWVQGVAGGTSLEYCRYGNGPNVFFATFCVHGYEDSWDRDGTVLVDIANNFYNRLLADMDKDLAQKWTIYIIKEINPDGRRLGYTKDGPGRTTLYSKIGKGIDINRSWQTDSYYKRYTDNRNYNGTSGFQAYEAEYLRNFLLSHKSTTGQNVLVDLHGWENQLIGNQQICNYYKQQYTSCSTKNYGVYGTQYLISWARQNLGAKSALIELPLAYNYEEVNRMRLSDKYIDATLNMLRGI